MSQVSDRTASSRGADNSFTIEVVPYSDEIIRAYRTLMPHQQEAVEGGKVAWKHTAHPAGVGNVAVARNAEGEIAGMISFQPVEFVGTGGQKFKGWQAIDLIVSESARGRGLFTKMVAYFQENSGDDLLYGFLNSQSSPGFFGKLGWTKLSAVPMMLKPINISFIARRIGLKKLSFNIPRLRRAKGKSTSIDSFGERHESVWREQRQRDNIGYALDRTAAFLKWRFIDHPTIDYDLWERPDGSFLACYMADKHGAKIAYIAEAIGEPETVADMLLEMTGIYASKGAEVIFAWCMDNNSIHTAYRRAGFYDFVEKLRPIKINFGVRPLNHADTAALDGSNWYLSYADSDTV